MDEEAIFAEVERRKARAKELGLIDLVLNSYLQTKDYPRYIERAPDSVHPEFRGAREVAVSSTRQGDQTHGVQVAIGDSSFVYSFRSRWISLPDGEGFNSGALTLAVDGNDVFGVDCSKQYDEEYDAGEWKAGTVNAFIEGPWIETLRTASRRLLDWDEERRREYEERSRRDKAAELKKNFGI